MDTNFTLTTVQANVPLYCLIGLTIIFLVCCLFAKFNLFAHKRINISLSALITIVTCQFVHYFMKLCIDKSFVWYVKICYQYFLICQLLLGIIGLTNYCFVSLCGGNVKLLTIVSTFLSFSLFLYGVLGYFIQFMHIYENEFYLQTGIQNYLILYLGLIFIGSYGIVSSFTNTDKEAVASKLRDTVQITLAALLSVLSMVVSQLTQLFIPDPNAPPYDPFTKIERNSTLVKITHTWKIANFSLCDVLNKEGYIDSRPLGDDKNIKFTIRVYPDDNGQVSFYLKFDSDVCKTLIVRWEFVLKKRWGDEYKRLNSKLVLTSGSPIGWKYFAKRSEIIDRNSSSNSVVERDGSLTVTFEICYDESLLMKSKVAPNC